MRDLRLYYYQSGTLKKAPVHKFKDEDSVERQIKFWHFKNRFKGVQFVLTEYTGVYESKIIKLL